MMYVGVAVMVCSKECHQLVHPEAKTTVVLYILKMHCSSRSGLPVYSCPEQAISKKMAYGTKNVCIDQRSAGFCPKDRNSHAIYRSLPQQYQPDTWGCCDPRSRSRRFHWGPKVIDTLNGLTGWLYTALRLPTALSKVSELLCLFKMLLQSRSQKVLWYRLSLILASLALLGRWPARSCSVLELATPSTLFEILS